MNLWKKTITFVCISVMMMIFAACGDTTNVQTQTDQTDNATPEETVATVISNLEKAESMKSLIVAESDMTTADTTSVGSTQAEVTTIYSPLSMEISTSSNLEKTPLVTYVQEKDGMATTYMEYAGQWMEQSVETNIAIDSLQMYDTRENAVLFLKNAQEWKVVSAEDNNIILEGTLSANALKTVVEDTKSLQVMGMAGLTEEYYEGVLDTTITLTVDTATQLPIRYTVDLSNTLEVLMNNVTSTFSSSDAQNLPQKTTVNQYTFTVECSDINEIKKVEIPQEVLNNAVDLEKQIENISIPTGENGEELAVE